MTVSAELPGKILDIIRPVADYQLQKFDTMERSAGFMKNRFEMVSEVDVTSESLLHKGLRSIIPEAAFFGEETVQERGKHRLMWVVDPLDGTTNFLKGIDIWTISVALMDNEQSVAAVIYRPVTEETFTAVRGGGARRNGILLPQALPRGLEGALIGTGLPFRSPDSMDAFFPCAREVLSSCLDIRRMGSASLDLAYVGADILQGFWEIDLQPYDVAAALLILEETGCRYFNGTGTAYDPFSSRLLVAGRPQLSEELLAIVSRHYAY